MTLSDATRVLVNPAAGAGRAGARAARARPLLEAAWPGLEWCETSGAEDVAAQCRTAAVRGYARVIIAGGDGTVHFALRGLAGTATALGVLPVGTGNDFALAVGMPPDPVAAAHALRGGSVVAADLGRANTLPFCCVAGIGMDSAALRLIDRSPLPRGKFLYQYAALRTLLSYRAPLLSFEMKDFHLQDRVLLAVFANTATYAGGNPVSPGSSIFDGRLDYCLFLGASRPQRLASFLAMRRGCHLGTPRVVSGSASHVNVQSPTAIPVILDGEPGSLTTPVEIRLWPEAIQVIRPRPSDC